MAVRKTRSFALEVTSQFPPRPHHGYIVIVWPTVALLTALGIASVVAPIMSAFPIEDRAHRLGAYLQKGADGTPLSAFYFTGYRFGIVS
jgi:hypothetical protein